MGDFTMPSLGADMEAGTVSQWLVQRGDEVRRGDIVAVVETEKSTIEVEIFEGGVIDEIVVPAGETVPVGTVLAHVTAPAARVGPTPGSGPVPTGAGTTTTAPAPAATAAVTSGRAAPAVTSGRAAPAVTSGPRAPSPHAPPPVRSPILRHLAGELGVDLTRVDGTGRDGEVTRSDVVAAARTQGGGAGGGIPGEGEPARPGRRTPSSPLARQLAAELGIELSALTGTGPGGSVVEHDVRLAAAESSATPDGEGVPTRERARGEAPAPTPAPPRGAPSPPAGAAAASPEVTRDRQAAMRRAIGALMARSKREIPHYYLSTTIDVSEAVAWLERTNLDRPIADRLVMPVLLLKATARAVARVPEINGFLVDGAFSPSEAVHVGVAISLRTGGVIAPAIHDTDRLSLDDLMARLRDLVGRARSGVLRSSEMSDPTITVTNLGDLGVEAVFGVIYPPQVALVGFGRVAERAYARSGMLAVRPCVTATLSADHRVSDGHRGGRFLAEIDRLLQEPEKL